MHQIKFDERLLVITFLFELKEQKEKPDTQTQLTHAHRMGGTVTTTNFNFTKSTTEYDCYT